MHYDDGLRLEDNTYTLSYNQNSFSITGINSQYVHTIIPSGAKIKWYAIGVGEEDTTLRDSLASILQEEGVSVTEEDDMASLISKVDEEFDRQVLPEGGSTPVRCGGNPGAVQILVAARKIFLHFVKKLCINLAAFVHFLQMLPAFFSDLQLLASCIRFFFTDRI